ncbi:transcriptional regulator [Burkholderia sp. MSh2]|uniref:Winged helix family two component transcriptional regulator n=1 Tax=Burkholderia paludis TaxID=1506587 RepID=A0A6P2I0K3_9BURK|nr:MULTISPECIES: response regulator transcription factor [Burkholderia]KEZ05818.1 transcriptional regulator [Burkholderia sp. MSh2]KFG95106.1 transcriptional regulator [Burkholderia paludis]CAB3746285.1 Sensory transduction protein regX3 [Burkholderia paludis]VWB24099.1 winged helix family two component transcriptional regulator [Burkholderia paludis]
MLIAVLEDDQDQRDLLMLWLEQGGHRALGFGTAQDLFEGIRRDPFSLFVVDWELPDASGGDVIQWVRNHLGWEVPLIVLTVRDDEQTVLAALKAGADDYVVKPARSAELLARIGTVARRYGVGSIAPLQLGVYTIDIQRVSLSVAGNPVDLTQKEFDLAAYMFQNPGKLLSRDHLLNRIWGVNADVDTRTIDTHVSRLRKKLLLDGTHGWKVVPVYGFGYRCVHLDDPA